MNRIIILLLVAITASTTAKAQEEQTTYKNAIGIRLGPSTPVIKSGISFKHFMNDSKAIEGIVSFGDGFAVCGLYEIHKPITAAEDLQWFIGFGGYAGFSKTTTNIGGAGIVGLNYNFWGKNIPLNISLDWKPELNIVQKVGFEGSTVGFSARYTF